MTYLERAQAEIAKSHAGAAADGAMSNVPAGETAYRLGWMESAIVSLARTADAERGTMVQRVEAVARALTDDADAADNRGEERRAVRLRELAGDLRRAVR